MTANELQIVRPALSPSEYVDSSGSAAGKVVIHTHGCKLNQADSSILARQFRLAGYEVVSDVAEADIYVLNTCTVTSTADSKARQALRAAHRANPEAVVVAAGCYPQRAAEELAGMAAVSLVVGNEDKANLASLAVAAHRERAGLDPGAPDDRDYSVSADTITSNLPGRSRAMVKIQEGCDQVCAYCIVPKVRGRERSIPPGEIIGEVNRRISEGCVEVALTGTQLGTYGFDLPGTNLRELIQRVLAETEITRLRVSSLQPQELDGDLLQLWLDDPRLCPHFHIPLQSGSDAILKTMRRRYSTRQFADAVQVIRKKIPHAGVTADVIVGFPGEGEQEFQDSLAFIRAMEFSDLHVFPYSRRPGTSAAHLNGRISPAGKKERVGLAMEEGRRSFERFRNSQLTTVRPVLWEGGNGATGECELTGLTDNYVRVKLDTSVASSGKVSLGNTVTPARLMRVSGKYVLAEAISQTGGPGH